jgi:hypothetical protein
MYFDDEKFTSLIQICNHIVFSDPAKYKIYPNFKFKRYIDRITLEKLKYYGLVHEHVDYLGTNKHEV